MNNTTNVNTESKTISTNLTDEDIESMIFKTTILTDLVKVYYIDFDFYYPNKHPQIFDDVIDKLRQLNISTFYDCYQVIHNVKMLSLDRHEELESSHYDVDTFYFNFTILVQLNNILYNIVKKNCTLDTYKKQDFSLVSSLHPPLIHLTDDYNELFSELHTNELEENSISTYYFIKVKNRIFIHNSNDYYHKDDKKRRPNRLHRTTYKEYNKFIRHLLKQFPFRFNSNTEMSV